MATSSTDGGAGLAEGGAIAGGFLPGGAPGGGRRLPGSPGGEVLAFVGVAEIDAAGESCGEVDPGEKHKHATISHEQGSSRTTVVKAVLIA